MIPINRQSRYDQIVTDIRNNYNYPPFSVEWEALFEYLENGGSPVTLHSTAFDNWYFSNLYYLIGHPDDWEPFDDRIMAMMSNYWASAPTSIPHYFSKDRFVEQWLQNCNAYRSLPTLQAIGQYLERYKINVVILGYVLIEKRFIFDESGLNSAKRYILNIADKILEAYPNLDNRYFFELLLKYDEPSFDKYSDELGINRVLNLNLMHLLLEHNAAKYEPFLVKVMGESYYGGSSLKLALVLNTYFPKKYEADIVAACYQYIEYIESQFTAYSSYYFDSDRTPGTYEYTYFINIVFSELYRLEPAEKVFEVIQKTLKACPCTSAKIIDLVYAWYGEKSLPILVEALSKRLYDNSGLENSVLESLKNHNHEVFYPQLWVLLPKSEKKMRSAIARHLAIVQGEAAIPHALIFLEDKKSDIRMLGVLILSVIKTENPSPY